MGLTILRDIKELRRPERKVATKRASTIIKTKTKPSFSIVS